MREDLRTRKLEPHHVIDAIPIGQIVKRKTLVSELLGPCAGDTEFVRWHSSQLGRLDKHLEYLIKVDKRLDRPRKGHYRRNT